MIRSEQHAKEVQQRRYAAGKFRIAAAVRRYYRRTKLGTASFRLAELPQRIRVTASTPTLG